jgi:hypothetical protein
MPNIKISNAHHAKINTYLCLTKHYAMKSYGGVDAQRKVFLTVALVEGEWSASRSCRFNPLVKRPRYPSDRWLAGWAMEPVCMIRGSEIS